MADSGPLLHPQAPTVALCVLLVTPVGRGWCVFVLFDAARLAPFSFCKVDVDLSSMCTVHDSILPLSVVLVLDRDSPPFLSMITARNGSQKPVR